jgi:carboxylesterase type B
LLHARNELLHWTQFAAKGNPNRRGLPEWQKYNPSTDVALELGEEIKAIATPRAERFFAFERILNTRLAALRFQQQ